MLNFWQWQVDIENAPKKKKKKNQYKYVCVCVCVYAKTLIHRSCNYQYTQLQKRSYWEMLMGAINKEGPWGHCWGSVLSHLHSSQVLSPPEFAHTRDYLVLLHIIFLWMTVRLPLRYNCILGTLLQARPNMCKSSPKKIWWQLA